VTAPPPLAAPGAAPGFLGRLAVPAELYWVLREPAPLVGMSFPHRADWAALHAIGLRHVVCLTHDVAPYDPAPLVGAAFGMQDLFVRHAGPDDPEAERAVVVAAAARVVECIRAGEGVAVHCHAGRGRTGTVIGCALVELGHDPEAVARWLDRAQRARNKPGWPEQDWQLEVVLAHEGAAPDPA
jgi:atypical dual specificity phosphatase